MFVATLLFCLTYSVVGFNPNGHLSQADVLRYKSFYRPIPFNTLIDEIKSKDVETIYFTPTMDNVIAENTAENDNVFNDYTATKITPFVSNYIVDKANEKEVQTIFLQQPPPNIFESAFTGGIQLINTFFFPALLIINLEFGMKD